MTDHLHLMSLLVGMTCSIVLPITVCFHRKLVFATWAKIISIMVCIGGLGWGILGLMLLYSSISDLDYSRIDGIKRIIGGICIGLVLGIMIARPYKRRAV